MPSEHVLAQSIRRGARFNVNGLLDRYPTIAMLDETTGELSERRLDHPSGEAEAFYRNLQGPVRVGIEASGPIRWFARLLAELGHELAGLDSAPQHPSHRAPTSAPDRANTSARSIHGLENLCRPWLQPRHTNKKTARSACLTFCGSELQLRHKFEAAKRLPFAVPFPRVFELLAPRLARSGPARSDPSGYI
jgi:hypothetical protein